MISITDSSAGLRVLCQSDQLVHRGQWTLFVQRKMKLLNALLALLETQKSGIALAALVLRADKGANDGVVRDLGEA